MDNIKVSELMNYELNSSNSFNYIPSDISSSPNSFPNLMEESIIIKYDELSYTSKIFDDSLTVKEATK